MNYLKFFFIVLFFDALLRAQSVEKKIARFDGGAIDEQDFLFRYEMTPYPRKHLDEFQDNIKMEFALSIIAEKLFAFEGSKNKDVLESDALKYLFPRMRSIILRDALYREVIFNPTRAKDDEIKKEYIKGLSKYKVVILSFENENLSKKFFEKFKRNEPLEKILQRAAENNIDTTTKIIEYGDLDIELENQLYKLDVGDISPVVISDKKWHIIIVKDVEININPTEAEKERVYGKVKSVMEGRKEEELKEKYLKQFFKDKKASSDGKILALFSRWLANKILLTQTESDSSAILFTYQFIREANEALSDEIMSAPFIFVGDRSYSLKEFLYDLIYIQNLALKKNAVSNIAAILNAKIKYFIENEFLALEAERKKLDTKKEVKKDINLWRDFYLAEVYKLKLKNEINIEESKYVKPEEKDSLKRKLFHLREIFSTNFEDISNALDEIKKGVDFKDAAKRYNKREETLKSDGELIFYDYLFPELAKVAENMSPGEIFGPIENSNGYSIIKLIDKKEYAIERESDKEKKLRIWNEIYAEKLEKKAAELAKKYNLKIFEKSIKEIKTTKVNVVSYRFYGFGGRTIAVPFVSPFWNWYYLMEEKKLD
jgi:parvulin-like peptidyl-prolyl isomerase